MIMLEICKNAENAMLAYAHSSTAPDSGFRIAGPKAWGGPKKLADVEISEESLAQFILEYAPNVLKACADRLVSPQFLSGHPDREKMVQGTVAGMQRWLEKGAQNV